MWAPNDAPPWCNGCKDDKFNASCINVCSDHCEFRHLIYPPKKPTPYEAGYGEDMVAPGTDNGNALGAGDRENDSVYHPQHYSQWKMEPIEFIAINDLPWWLANVIKYTMRFNLKDGLQDLYKARSYLDMKIRQIEGHIKFWEKPVSVERGLAHKHSYADALEGGWALGLEAAADDDMVNNNPRVEGMSFEQD